MHCTLIIVNDDLHSRAGCDGLTGSRVFVGEGLLVSRQLNDGYSDVKLYAAVITSVTIMAVL